MSKIYCLKKELENLDKLGGRDLALVYANPIIGSYRKGIDAHEARPAYMEWVSEKLCAIHDAIQTYLKKSAIDYPYPYNQQLRGTHDGAYKMAVAEKEIVRGIMNYQKLGGRVVNYAKGAKFLPQIIDYEVPMFCLKEGNVSSRKIDAVGRAIGAQRDRLYIYEAKKNNSDETLLRCLMEAFSYSLFVDRVRFKESFGVRQNTTIVLSPLIFEGSVPHRDLRCALSCSEEKSLFDTLLERIRKVANVDVEFAVVRKTDFIIEGKPVFPNVKDTKFKLEWLD